jgi:hypothetical protein
MMAQTAGTLPADTAQASVTVEPAVLARRIQSEYVEMPGLTLTGPQAARLWNLNVHQAEGLLAELVERGFLMRDRRGSYRRRGCPRCS